jgi:hypothetical protein
MEKETPVFGSHDRVVQNTPREINDKNYRAIESMLQYYAKNPDKIDRRLAELAGEWDVERYLESNAAAISLFALIMGTVGRKYWMLLIPIAVAGFLMQHAIQGWCPPVVLFRRLGIRTKSEIHLERTALRALRNDFGPICDSRAWEMPERVSEVLRALKE